MAIVTTSSLGEAVSRYRRSVPLRGHITITLALAATILVLVDAQIPVVRATAGLFLLVGLPTHLVLVKKAWWGCSRHEAVIYSLGAVLLAVMIGGLAMNELLPLIGVSRPLDRVPVLVATDVWLLALAFRQLAQRVGDRMAAPAHQP
jgi:uncharacterized membrane protein